MDALISTSASASCWSQRSSRQPRRRPRSLNWPRRKPGSSSRRNPPSQCAAPRPGTTRWSRLADRPSAKSGHSRSASRTRRSCWWWMCGTAGSPRPRTGDRREGIRMGRTPPQSLELISWFDCSGRALRSPHYTETQLRRELLAALFKALGSSLRTSTCCSAPFRGFASAWEWLAYVGQFGAYSSAWLPHWLQPSRRPRANSSKNGPGLQLSMSWYCSSGLRECSRFRLTMIFTCRRPGASVRSRPWIPNSSISVTLRK